MSPALHCASCAVPQCACGSAPDAMGLHSSLPRAVQAAQQCTVHGVLYGTVCAVCPATCVLCDTALCELCCAVLHCALCCTAPCVPCHGALHGAAHCSALCVLGRTALCRELQYDVCALPHCTLLPTAPDCVCCAAIQSVCCTALYCVVLCTTLCMLCYNALCYALLCTAGVVLYCISSGAQLCSVCVVPHSKGVSCLTAMCVLGCAAVHCACGAALHCLYCAPPPRGHDLRPPPPRKASSAGGEGSGRQRTQPGPAVAGLCYPGQGVTTPAPRQGLLGRRGGRRYEAV